MILLSFDGSLALDSSVEFSVSDSAVLSLRTPLGAFFQRPDFGCELYLLSRSKAIPGKIEPRATRMVKSALQWMVDLGLLKVSPDVRPSLISPTKLWLPIPLQTDAGLVRLDYWIPVPNQESV